MNLKFCGGMYFWGSGLGRERERGGVGEFLGYVWEGM